MSLFDSFLSFVMNSSDPEAAKKRQLKMIAKDISHCKFNFYNAHNHTATPACAKFFFEVYRTVSSAQQVLQNSSTSKVLRETIIDLFLSQHQREAAERLSEASINERAQANPTELAAQVKADIQTLGSEFTSDSAQNIDKTYSLLIMLSEFSAFDYFFTLKKFNSSISEHSFSAVPSFEAIRADYILEDLREFTSLVNGLPLSDNWSTVFAAVKKIKGIDLVNPRQWTKMITLLQNVRKSGILELMIRHIAQQPDEKITPTVISEHIVDEYVQKLRTSAELMVQKIQTEKRNGKIGQLAVQIFGTAEVVRLKNYTEKMNIQFSKKMLSGYTHIEDLNYTKAFLIDYYKRDVRELINLFLVKGKWTSNIVSTPLSEAFYALMEISEKLTEFDDGLAPDAAMGQKIKTILTKADRDKEQVNFLRNLLKDLNNTANTFILNTARHCISIGKILKQLIEDFDRPQKEFITNWAEITKAANTDIKPAMVTVYKKIYNFVMLLQCYVKQ